MLSRRSTPLIAAALMMSLAGCVTASRDEGSLVLKAAAPAATAAANAERRGKRAPACPTQTDDAKAERIADYLEMALPDPGLDALATEWERLNDGAGTCRTGVAQIGGLPQ